MLSCRCLAEIKAANHKHRNDQLNRALQNMMFATLGEANEMASKKALGLLTELWRRQIWRDARTANVIGMFHAVSVEAYSRACIRAKSSTVLVSELRLDLQACTGL